MAKCGQQNHDRKGFMDYFLLAAVLCSVSVNIILLIQARSKEKEIEMIREDARNRIESALEDAAKSKKETLTIDAQQILHDLTHGGAVVRITPIDPTQLFYRAPRG